MPGDKSIKFENWKPEPLDLSGISLPPEIEPLVERLAENIHDVWAAKRASEGWSYGPMRSDELKQTPNLVPYGGLEESEREYDRAVAAETLRSIISLGFEIRRGGELSK